MNDTQTILARTVTIPFAILVNFFSILVLDLVFPVLIAGINDLIGNKTKVTWVAEGRIALWPIGQSLTTPSLRGLSACFGIMVEPAAQAMPTKRVFSLEQGRLQGSVISAFALPGIFAPPVFGPLYGNVVFEAQLGGAPFVGAILILGVAVVLAAGLNRLGEQRGDFVGTTRGRINARP